MTARSVTCAFIGGYGIARAPLHAVGAWCYGRGHRLLGLITQPVKINGVIDPSKLNVTAQEGKRFGLPVYFTESLARVEKESGSPDDRRAYDFLQRERPDFVVVVGSGLKIPAGLLALPATRFINLHPSFLPAYRGAAAVQRAIANGERETGVTIHDMDEQFDHGPILMQRRCSIKPDDDAEDLTRRLTSIGTELLVDTLNGILDGTVTPHPQPDRDPKNRLGDAIREGERRILWTQYSAETVVNRVRGFKEPHDGCRTQYHEHTLQIREAAALPSSGVRYEPSEFPPGTIVGVHPTAGITVLAANCEPVLLRRFVTVPPSRNKDKPLAQVMMEIGMERGESLI